MDDRQPCLMHKDFSVAVNKHGDDITDLKIRFARVEGSMDSLRKESEASVGELKKSMENHFQNLADSIHGFKTDIESSKATNAKYRLAFLMMLCFVSGTVMHDPSKAWAIVSKFIPGL